MTASGLRSPAHRAALLAAFTVAALFAALWAALPANADFGVQPESFQSSMLDSAGAALAEPQAGAHPFAQRVRFSFNTTHHEYPEAPHGQYPPSGPEPDPDGEARTIITELPPGFIGNPQATPQCTPSDFPPLTFAGYSRCPTAAQVGVASLDLGQLSGFPYAPGSFKVPVYNLVPPKGVVARLGFVEVEPIVLDITLRSGGDYGVTATSLDTSEAVNLYAVSVTLWGVPADSSHDAERYLPGNFGPGDASGNPLPSGLPPTPFLTNPTSCTGEQTTALRVSSWQNPELLSYVSSPQSFVGCERLPFSPTLSATPDSAVAGAPAGLTVDLHIPQSAAPDALATAELKDATVTLPLGMALNPSSADGLDACSEDQIAIHSPAPATCPDAAKIGSVEIRTPVLKDPLQGSVYLAAQGANPFRSTFAIYIAIADPDTGVVVKLAGQVEADPGNGRLTVSFKGNPQLPFEDLEMNIKGGDRAPLVNPSTCGTYTTEALLGSWSGKTVASDTNFTIDQNCAAAGSFTPTLQAGTIGNAAGASSPFTMTLTRPDGQQQVSSLALTLPSGLVGKLAGIPLCPDAQANVGSCSPASQIGKVAAAAGAGSSPLWVPMAGKTPTAVYLSGPYKGAPFSLSVAVPAEAGPFNLGTVVVRAALFVDPHDAHVSVTSDSIPTILDGVPLNVQKINVTLDRPGFMISPTNCAPMQITGTATSSAGSSAALSSPFQVGSCGSLKFVPRFSVSTVGRASKANGASLTAKLSFPANQGTQANIGKVKVELPRQLPSRLTTLQKACTSAQFDANPAGCPAASFIGRATVHTPLLPVPLTGPAIFVSHGGEAFPSLVMVLQGYGVTVDLVGTTLIRSGVTSTTFKTVPDVPFNDFELTLGQGKFSALAANLPAKANGSFCGQKMVMPTEFIAQNGALVKQSTPIAITGCTKAKAQKLAATLKACKKKSQGQRAGCARAARRQLATVAKRRGTR